MSSFKLHGPFRPGVKRFNADEFGNDCMLFYPVNKSVNPIPFNPYRDLKTYVASIGISGQGAAGKTAFFHR